jgi:hypothetical protein
MVIQAVPSRPETKTPRNERHTIADAAERSGVREPMVYCWIKDGFPSLYKAGGARNQDA